MVRLPLLFTAIAVLGGEIGSTSASYTEGLDTHLSFAETCQEIAASISVASNVYYNASPNYAQDIEHYTSSSTQLAACSFEPGTAEDVGIALQIIGQTQTPFAVKGGGHATNPGFSSTVGVQIAMSRFSDIDYNSEAQTVTVGAGLIWDDVHAALEPYGVNVVGGRISGVGVAGLTLGGGYSWLTNQYGLTIDTVQAFGLVMPNGTVVDVTEASSPDLFFALKGGLNNFGIVTSFTFKAFPQTQVWGGLIIYTADVLDRVNLATVNFEANSTDPKAVIVTSYVYTFGLSVVAEILFYDGPTPPARIFDEFLAIPSLTRDVYARSYLSFVQSIPLNVTTGTRGTFNTISVTNYPLSLLQSIYNESVYWGENLALESTVFVLYDVQIFLPTLLNHNTTPSAYPPSRTQGLAPLNIYFAWASPDSDQRNQNAARTTAQTLRTNAIDGGQSEIANAALYPNYAIFDTPLVDLYGDNLPRLKDIKAAVDPKNVMGLTGGFKL